MNIELHVLQNGAEIGVLPSYASVNLSPVFCDYGSISFTYPKAGKKWSLIAGKDEFEVVPYIDGVANPRLGGLVKEVDGDDVEEAAVFSFNGIGYLALLDEALVYPYNWPTIDPKATSWTFLNATAGTIIRTLVQAAQARGTLTGVTTAFTNTTDTNGVAWNKTLSVEITPGVTITEVLKNLHDQGMCEFVMNGRELRMHVDGGLSVDRTVVTPPAKPLTFRKGRDLRDSPRKTSSRDIATVMLAAGKEDVGIYHEEVDAAAVAGRRRIEGYVSNGSISDEGTLNAFSEYNLGQRKQAKMEKTHGLEFAHPKSPRPVANFDVGDWCYSDTGSGMEKLRIKQWVLAVENNGKVSGSVVLNDLFAEMNERLAKRIDGIIGGTTITGESRAVDVVPEGVLDTMPPKVPTGLALSSSAYTDDKTGQTYAQVSASWLQVTQNDDGTAIEDLAGYQIRWRYTAEAPGYRYVTTGTETSTSWSPVTTNSQVQAEIRSFDENGNYSAWSAYVLVQSGFDTTAPEVPATPVADNYLGMIRLSVSGLTASGAAWAPDFNYIEVHASVNANFTPTYGVGGTHIDSLGGAGRTFTKGTYGAATYFKIRSVDHNGNKSAFTPEVSASGGQVVSNDIFDGAVGSAKIADLAVTSAKINLLAVNSAQVGSLDVGKLVAGTLSAQVILGNRITTAATGARTELNQIGIQAWDAASNKTIDLNGTTNLLTGTLQTAISGRRIVMGSAGNTGALFFYAPDGTVAELTIFTGNNTPIEAVRLGVQKPTRSEYWNKIQINEDSSFLSALREYRWIIGGGNIGEGTEESFRIDYTPTPETPSQPFFNSTKPRMYVGKTNFSVYDDTATNRVRIGTNGGTSGATYLKYPKIGVFQIWEWDDTTTERARLQFSSGGMTIWDTNGQNRILSSSTRSDIYGNLFGLWALDGTALMIVQQPGENYFAWSGSNATVRFAPTGRADTSARLKLVHPNLYGTTILYRAASDGTSSRIEFMDIVESGYCPLWAASFTQASSRTTKKGITEMGPVGLELIEQIVPKHFRRKKPGRAGEPETPDVLSEAGVVLKKGRKGTQDVITTELDREELGVIAEEVPAVMRVESDVLGPAVDLGAWTAINTQAIKELHAMIKEMKQ